LSVAIAKQASELPIRSQEDVVIVRQAVRKAAVELGLSLIDQTKIVTAASELARNTFIYGGGGTVLIEEVASLGKPGLRLTFLDQGPGIADISRALSDGFTTGGGLGLGLGGAKRLSSEFSIESEPGKGTCVVITRWKG
jgi:serine/threonine-protein kinase RsbT